MVELINLVTTIMVTGNHLSPYFLSLQMYRELTTMKAIVIEVSLLSELLMFLYPWLPSSEQVNLCRFSNFHQSNRYKSSEILKPSSILMTSYDSSC